MHVHVFMIVGVRSANTSDIIPIKPIVQQKLQIMGKCKSLCCRCSSVQWYENIHSYIIRKMSWKYIPIEVHKVNTNANTN